MEQSQKIKNLGKALIAFKVKMGKIHKNGSNPFFKNKYATLDNILEAIEIPLAECNLSFSQWIDEDNTLTNILLHAGSGEYLKSKCVVNPVKADPQALGSAITYMRRYSISSALGLSFDDDDDGSKASGLNEVKKKTESKAAVGDSRKWLNPATPEWDKVVKYLATDTDASIIEVKKKYKISAENEKQIYIDAKI